MHFELFSTIFHKFLIKSSEKSQKIDKKSKKNSKIPSELLPLSFISMYLTIVIYLNVQTYLNVHSDNSIAIDIEYFSSRSLKFRGRLVPKFFYINFCVAKRSRISFLGVTIPIGLTHLHSGMCGILWHNNFHCYRIFNFF